MNRVAGSLRAYKYAYMHVEKFLNEKYKLTYIPFTALDCSFIEKYDFHLRTDCHLALGTIVHLTTSFRTIINEAVADGILTFNPFWGYEPERPQREQKYLTAEELELIMTTPLHNARLYIIRDLFLFSCYTGISYGDMCLLTKEDLVTDENGTLWILILLCGYAKAQTRGGDSSPPLLKEISAELFDKAVALIKEFEGWYSAKHYPYIGYGHKLLPHENLTADITEAQADSLLRADLLERYKYSRQYGKDALLLTVLAYNVGHSRLQGYGKRPKSNLIKKIESGDRDIYEEYILYRCYKGKPIPSIERRRKREFQLLYIP